MWREGPVPIWRSLKPADLSDLDVVVERLSKYTPSDIVRGPAVKRPHTKGRKSAVLIGLFPGDTGATMILTRRPQHMRKHAGEIAFPGGAVDDGDPSLWHTALREAEEEIALDPQLPIHVADLDRFVTGASYSLVQPIVARLENRPDLEASPDEVDRIIETPLAELLEAGVYRPEEWLSLIHI